MNGLSILGTRCLRISWLVVFLMFSSLESAANGIAPNVDLGSNTGSAGQLTSLTTLTSLAMNNGCTGAPPGGRTGAGMGVASDICIFLGSIAINQGTTMVGGNSATAMQQLSTQADINASAASLARPTSLKRSISIRLGAIRLSQQNTEGQSTLLAVSDETNYSMNEGVSSASFGRFGVFLTSKGSFGDLDTNEGETGFDQKIVDVSTGIDYRVTDDIVTGLAFGYANVDNDLNLSSGHLQADIYRLAAFASFAPTRDIYIDAILGHAWHEFDVRRICTACPAAELLGQSGQTDFDGTQYFATIGTGYTHRFGALGVKFYGKGDYTYTQTDAYSLTFNLPASLFVQNVGDQDIKSLTSTLGLEISHNFNTDIGVIIPRVRAEWVHEFKNAPRAIANSFNCTGCTASSVASLSTVSPERNWWNIGFTAQMILPNSITAFLGYEALIIQDASNHVVSGGIRYEF